jgi:hypothetical protein
MWLFIATLDVYYRLPKQKLEENCTSI